MSDLVSCLLEAIEQAEEAARACGGAPWVDNVPGMVHVDPVAIRDSKWTLGHLGYVVSADNSPIGDAYRRHIVRNAPSSVLRHCKADRATVIQYELLLSRKDYAPGLGVTLGVLKLIVERIAVAYGITEEET
jgi:hypothetical protein